MKSQRIRRLLLCSSLFACLLLPAGAVALAVSPQASAGVETPTPEIQDATINLYCYLRIGNKSFISSGSGTFISERGVILTNAHVAQYFLLASDNEKIRSKCSVRTGSPAKRRYTASVLYFPSVWVEDNAAELSKNAPKGTGENDFALLYITSVKKSDLARRFPALTSGTASNINEQEIVAIAGYPTEGLDSNQIRSELAVATASSVITNTQSFRSGRLPDILTLAPSDAGSTGVSGGPVVSGSGEVIGIVTSKSTAKDNRTLRAITLSYIDRVLQAQTGLPLDLFLTGDLAARANSMNKSLTPEILKIVTDGLLKRKWPIPRPPLYLVIPSVMPRNAFKHKPIRRCEQSILSTSSL